jgi:hypothetical protein
MAGDKDPFLIAGSDDYRGEIRNILAIIKSQNAGRAVVNEIQRLGILALKPYGKADFNATTDDLGPRAVVIAFSPATFASEITIRGIKVPKVPDVRSKWPGMVADEVLLHEMVHAANGLGPGFKVAKLLTGKMAPYENEEEFFAILAANIYISEKGKPPAMLRNSHFLVQQGMTDWEAISEVFLFEWSNFGVIDRFCKQNEHFARMLARVHSRFNPLRSYFLFMASSDPYPADLPDPGEVPMPSERLEPTRDVAFQARIALSDSSLIELLEKRFRADDLAGYGGRLRQFRRLIETVNRSEAFSLFVRLRLRPPGDRVAQLFHDHLSTATRNQVLGYLKWKLVTG